MLDSAWAQIFVGVLILCPTQRKLHEHMTCHLKVQISWIWSRVNAWLDTMNQSRHTWQTRLQTSHTTPTRMSRIRYNPPKDGGLRDFYHNWTNSILHQLKRKFWKIEDVLFRISSMTKFISIVPRWECRPYSLVPDPQNFWNCEFSGILGWKTTCELCP